MIEDLQFFVHVPKTGGSSINAMLKASGKSGRPHFENLLQRQDQVQLLKSLGWISGHIALDEALLLTKGIGRKVRLYSCVREPMSHLISRISWLISHLDRGTQSFYRLPVRIQALSLEGGLVNYQEPRAVMAFLLKNRNAMMNYQSRHVLGSSFEQLKSPDVDAILGKYEYVGLMEDMSKLTNAMELRPGTTIPKENVSIHRVPGDIFETLEVRAFLKHHNSADLMLYDKVKNKFA